MIRVGIIGYGYWGPNLVRNFAESQDSKIIGVSDMREERLSLVKRLYPSVKATKDHKELLADDSIDAVAIATPVSSHFELAMQALRAGKHVLVEKPLVASSEQAGQLIKEAKRRKLVLMVDHTFVYTGAVNKIKELVTGRKIGDIYYYDSVRVNLGLFQHDVNVIWDLAVHDVSIMDYILELRPIAVSATGISHISNKMENISYLTLFFERELIAHIHVNWLAPVKIRRTLIGGSKKMIVYDDLEPSEKIKIYDKGITVTKNTADIYDMLISYRVGDMWAPKVDISEALRREVSHFVRCIEKGERPITDGDSGLRVVRILEAATLSMARCGAPVSLKNKKIK